MSASADRPRANMTATLPPVRAANAPRAPDRLGLPASSPTIALLPWACVLDDFLEPNGLSFETFCSEFRGSWMFGYVDALRAVGVRTVITCVTRSVRRPSRFVHLPTGAPILALPPPRLYRALSRSMKNPHGFTVEQTFGSLRGLRRLGRPVLELVREVAPYLSTPPRLLARELQRESCRAILCQEYEFPRFDVCAILSKLTGIPLYGVFQGGEFQIWRLERLTRPFSMRSCRGLIIGSLREVQRVREQYSAVPSEKVALIPNPINIDVWAPGNRDEARAILGIREQARVAVWHGRVDVAIKGLDILLEAWAEVCRTRDAQNLRLLLIGDGVDAREVSARIETSALENVIFLNTFVHEPETLRMYLNAADVYALSSRREGFPVALLEAMACGVPVVAADVTGVRQLISEDEAAGGILVPPEDPGALARAMGRLLDDEALSRNLGERARSRAVEDFSLLSIGQQLRAFLLTEAASAVAAS